jgi:hypothetical protein
VTKNIYDKTIISESTRERFRPTRLAIKELAGQLYFCKSTLQDIHSYSGSGVRWKKRITKYGKENIKTLWVSDWYYCPYEIQEVALHFSRENRIVENERWANIKPENGLDGGAQPPEIVARIFSKIIGRTQSPESNEKRRDALLGRIISEETIKLRKETLKRNGTTKDIKANKNPMYDTTIYRFINDNGIEENLTRYDLQHKYQLSQPALSMVIGNHRKKHKGWSIVR